MFDNTITLTRGGASVALVRINQDAYSSEYRLRTATEEHRFYIRHSKEKADSLKQMERHNFVYERTLFGTATTKEVLESVSVTARYQIGTDPATCLATALAGLGFGTSANLTRVIAGES